MPRTVKTTEEKLKEIEEKKNALERRKRAILNEAKEKERKDRNHRLIETGGLLEKATGMELQTKEERELLLDVLMQKRNWKNFEGSVGEYIARLYCAAKEEKEKDQNQK